MTTSKIMPCIYRIDLKRSVFFWKLKQLLKVEVLHEYQQRLYKIVSNVITYHQYINAWTCTPFKGERNEMKWSEEKERKEKKTH